MIKLDWAAPIVPRESCLGLTLGTTIVNGGASFS